MNEWHLKHVLSHFCAHLFIKAKSYDTSAEYIITNNTDSQCMSVPQWITDVHIENPS